MKEVIVMTKGLVRTVGKVVIQVTVLPWHHTLRWYWLTDHLMDGFTKKISTLGICITYLGVCSLYLAIKNKKKKKKKKILFRKRRKSITNFNKIGLGWEGGGAEKVDNEIP